MTLEEMAQAIKTVQTTAVVVIAPVLLLLAALFLRSLFVK